MTVLIFALKALRCNDDAWKVFSDPVLQALQVRNLKSTEKMRKAFAASSRKTTKMSVADRLKSDSKIDALRGNFAKGHCNIVRGPRIRIYRRLETEAQPSGLQIRRVQMHRIRAEISPDVPACREQHPGTGPRSLQSTLGWLPPAPILKYTNTTYTASHIAEKN
jgi:hypothetical protein